MAYTVPKHGLDRLVSDRDPLLVGVGLFALFAVINVVRLPVCAGDPAFGPSTRAAGLDGDGLCRRPSRSSGSNRCHIDVHSVFE